MAVQSEAGMVAPLEVAMVALLEAGTVAPLEAGLPAAAMEAPSGQLVATVAEMLSLGEAMVVMVLDLMEATSATDIKTCNATCFISYL
jgi:hypothetical protein